MIPEQGMAVSDTPRIEGMSMLLQAALELAAKDVPVFACGARKRPCWSEEEGGKGFHDASTEIDAVRRMFSHPRARLIGVPTGAVSGIDVLDVDYRHGGGAFEDVNQHRWPETRTHRTMHDGRHYLFRHDPAIRCTAGKVAPGIDIRGSGGYVIYPPSAGYEVRADVDIADWPEWLRETVLAAQDAETRKRHMPLPDAVYAPASDKRIDGIIRQALAAVSGAAQGQKHYVLLRRARQLGGVMHLTNISDAEIIGRLLDALPEGVEDWRNAEQTALDGLLHGKASPLELEDRPHQRVNGNGGTYTNGASHGTPDSGHAEPTPGDAWGEPVDFFTDDTYAVPTLETHHVPDVIYDFAMDTAERLGVDPTAVALTAAACCAAVTSDDWHLQPKKNDTLWTECARLWVGTVGDPGVLKTPLINACVQPIEKLVAKTRQDYDEAIAAHRATAAKAKADGAEEPAKPKRVRYAVKGMTMEALQEVLRVGERATMTAPMRKVLCHQDELAELIGGIDQYKANGKGTDRGAWLRLYNGGPHEEDRVTRGHIDIPNWSACVVGGIQPGVIRRIAKLADEDGMLQRFVFCVPGEQQEGKDRKPDMSAVNRYLKLFPTLASMHPAPPCEGEAIPALVFHEAAHSHREHVNKVVRAISRIPDTSPKMKAALNKWPGLFARLCLTFHMIEVADLRAAHPAASIALIVSGAIAEKVRGFMLDVVLPHLRRAYAAMYQSEQSGHAAWIAGYILSRHLTKIATRDIVQAYRALRAPEMKRELASVMDGLVALGWVQPEPPKNSANPVSVWTVNPTVHTLFARRAREEKARREAERAALAEAFALMKSGRKPQPGGYTH